MPCHQCSSFDRRVTLARDFQPESIPPASRLHASSRSMTPLSRSSHPRKIKRTGDSFRTMRFAPTSSISRVAVQLRITATLVRTKPSMSTAKRRQDSLWQIILRAPRNDHPTQIRVNAEVWQSSTTDPPRGNMITGTPRKRAYHAMIPFATILAPTATNRRTASGRRLSKRPMNSETRPTARTRRTANPGGGLLI